MPTPPIDRLLDALGRPAPPWTATMSKGLLTLTSGVDTFIEFPVLHSMLEPATQALAVGAATATGALDVNAGHPEIARLLNGVSSYGQLPPALRHMSLVCIELALRDAPKVGEQGDRRIPALASVLLGCLSGHSPSSRALLYLMKGRESLVELAAAMEAWRDADKRHHKTFGRLWFESGLGQTVSHLVEEAASRASRTAVPAGSWLSGQASMDSVVTPLIAVEPERADEVPDVDLLLIESGTPIKRALAQAAAEFPWRRTYVDIVADPDRVMPVCIGRTLVCAAFQALRSTAVSGVSQDRERLVGLLLMAATGVSEAELPHIALGNSPSQTTPVVLDTCGSALLRLEARQPRKVDLALDPGTWEQTGGAVHFPLPVELLAVISELLDARQSGRLDGESLFPGLRDLVASTGRIQIRDVMETLIPGLSVSPSALRARIAAKLAEKLGPEVAQLALGDAFALSPSVVSYSRTAAGTIADTVWSCTAPLFACAPDQLPHGFVRPTHHVGSRFAAYRTKVKEWSSGLRVARDGAARGALEAPLEHWRSQAVLLAVAIMATTGHRPNRTLGEITLYDFIPELGLVTLGDKQSDPAHMVRVSATGDRLLVELFRYVKLLAQCARRSYLGSSADLARRILSGEAPLFSMPGSAGPAPMELSEVLQGMPATLAPVPNALRHRLNQWLQELGIDPELRHAQLGWQVTDCHALSDTSPLSPAEMARQLAPAVDELLVLDGWVAGSTRLAWSWDAVPMPPLMDWTSIRKDVERRHEELSKELVSAYRERSQSCLAQLWPALLGLVPQYLKGLSIDRSRRRLIQSAGTSPGTVLNVTEEAVAALVARVAATVDDPIAIIVARRETVRLLRAGHRDRVVAGHIPKCQWPSSHSLPPTFLRGAGVAVRQIESLRRLVAERIADPRHMADAGNAKALFVLSVLISSPYRSLTQAEDIASGLRHAAYSQQEGHILRIDSTQATGGHYVLAGALAVLAARVAALGGGRWPAARDLVAWLRDAAPQLIPTGAKERDVVDRLVATAQEAARFELSGPERLLLCGQGPGLSTDSRRAIADLEGWEAEQNGDATTMDAEPDALIDGSSKKAPAGQEPGGRSCVLEVIRLLNNHLDQTLPRTGTTILDGDSGWSGRVRRELECMIRGLGESRSLPALIARYAHHLLDQGGRRRRRLAKTSPHTMVARFASRLHSHAGNEQLADLEPDEIERIYLAMMIEASRELKDATVVLASLRQFHHYLVRYMGAPEVDWAMAVQAAGRPARVGEAGLLRPAEMSLIARQLIVEHDAAEMDPSIDPRERRLRALRSVAFTLLHATGIRPASVYGLTYADLHLEGADAFVHVRSTGRYGSAKTPTSRGFVPLEGALWEASKPWILGFLWSERARLGMAFNLDLPVFGQFDSPRRREPRAWIFGRLQQLVRWATGIKKARLYWVRKTVITARHRRIASMSGAARARDVNRVLAVSGHAHILTPLTSYICDPAVPRAAVLRESCATPPGHLLTVSGMPPATLNAAWHKAAKRQGELKPDARVTEVLRRVVGANAALTPITLGAVAPAAPDPLYRSLRLRDVEAYLLARQAGVPSDQLAERLGLAQRQCDLLGRAVKAWREYSGRSVVPSTGRPDIERPRNLRAHEALRDRLMADPPLPELLDIAASWAGAAKRVPLSVGIALPVQEARARAAAWLETLELRVSEIDHHGAPVLQPRLGLGGRSVNALLQWAMVCAWVWGRVMGPGPVLTPAGG